MIISEERMEEINTAYDEYLKEYEKKKNEIISKLTTIKMSKIPVVYEKWLNQTINFIKEQKG